MLRRIFHRHVFLPIALCALFASASSPTVLADELDGPERMAVLAQGAEVSADNLASILEHAQSMQPAGFEEGPLSVELLEESVHSSGSQVLRWGRWLHSGHPILGGDFRYHFDAETGALRLVQCPLFEAEDLLERGSIVFGVDSAVEMVRETTEVTEGLVIEAEEPVYSTSLRTFLIPVLVGLDGSSSPRDRFDPEKRGHRVVWVDATNGEVALEENVVHEFDVVSGSTRGLVQPATGASIRAFPHPGNPPIEMLLEGIPVHIYSPPDSEEPSATVLTDELGEFSFEIEDDAEWRVEVELVSEEFRFIHLTDRETYATETGIGGNVLDIDLTPIDTGDACQEDLDPAVCLERRVATLTSFRMLPILRQYANERRIRAGYRLRNRRLATELDLENPREYPLDILRGGAEDPESFLSNGFYTDFSFPPTIGLSVATHRVLDFANIVVLSHEYGHYLAFSMTGTRNRGGFPLGPKVSTAEALADFFSYLFMTHFDLDGEDDGIIGRERDRDAPESFHRDMREGRSCLLPRNEEETPCFERRGFGVYPPMPGQSEHENGIILSGFLFDLWGMLAERYGREEGLERIEDLYFGFIGLYQGAALPPFDRTTPILFLWLDDRIEAGGDNVPQNGSPNADLIANAAAQHNLWLFPFIRGDANGDGSYDLTDPVSVLRFLFNGQSQLVSCQDAADADDSGSLEISDAVTLLMLLFNGGDPLPEPFVECGLDPTPDDGLTCDRQTADCGGDLQ